MFCAAIKILYSGNQTTGTK